ncbi:MAG TPA: helix-turn-helix domain-containing protein [Gammaproteobacteria bacterium]|nr:helix-turn-helix domain-containing protein [Gammaproteobacteria bacterium]
MSTKRRIGFLVYDGVTALDLAGPLDAFATPTVEETARPVYELVTLGLMRKACVAESGMSIRPNATLADAPPLDTMIVPGGGGLREPKRLRQVSDWLAARGPNIRRVASVCTGIYALANAGLLDGRRATTHWRFVDDVARRFPRVRLEPNSLFIKDGRFYTSAGVTSGIDLSLALIEEDLGPRAALAVARELVVYLKRPGGQEQFSEPLKFQVRSSSGMSNLVAHIAAHLTADLSVEALARSVALSPRQLSRRCRELFAASPGALVERIRLDAARARLTEPASRVDQIAASVGYRSADVFQRAFERRFGLNPSAYRSRFAGIGADAAP